MSRPDRIAWIASALSFFLVSTAFGQSEIGNLFDEPGSREYMEYGEEAAQCFGILIQVEPEMLEEIRNSTPITNVDELLLSGLFGYIAEDQFMDILVGEGMRYEMVFEHGSFYEGSSFDTMQQRITGWNFFLRLNLLGAVQLNELPEEHLRLFDERQENSFGMGLGLAAGGGHRIVDERLRSCFESWRWGMNAGDFPPPWASDRVIERLQAAGDAIE